MQPFVYRGTEVSVVLGDITTLPDIAAVVRTEPEGPVEPVAGPVVVRVVGPVWEGGHRSEFVNLERAWFDALREAVKQGCRSVAVPSISTGAHGFPVPQAARVGLNSVYRFLREEPGGLDRVVVVLTDEASFRDWADAQHEITETMLG